MIDFCRQGKQVLIGLQLGSTYIDPVPLGPPQTQPKMIVRFFKEEQQT